MIKPNFTNHFFFSDFPLPSHLLYILQFWFLEERNVGRLELHSSLFCRVQCNTVLAKRLCQAGGEEGEEEEGRVWREEET